MKPSDVIEKLFPITEFCRAKPLQACAWVLLLLAMLMQMVALPGRSYAKVAFKDVNKVVRFLPLLPLHNGSGASSFTHTISYYYSDIEHQQTAFQILPGACARKIMVNGVNVPFENQGYCNPMPGFYWDAYTKPYYIDLYYYLHEGRNEIQIESMQSEFNIGPLIMYDTAHYAYWLGLLMALVASVALYVIVRRYGGDEVSAYIIVGGFLVYLSRFSQSGISEFAMDLPGHLNYAFIIARDGLIPKPYEGWSFYHPPLFYTLQALVMRGADWLRSVDVITVMQLFSLLCFTSFIMFSSLLLRRIVPGRLSYYIALALLVFYPGGILFSARIDSHMLFYSCYIACLYFTLRWLEEKDWHMAGLALVMLGLSLAARSNGLILLPLLGLAAMRYYMKNGLPAFVQMRLPVMWFGIACVLLGVLANFGRIEYYHFTETRHEPFVVGNIGRLAHGLLIDKEPAHILIPNFSSYISRPFWNVWSDADGRQFFWNSLLKSSITGEFHFDGRGPLARLMGNLLLAMIFYVMEAYRLHRAALKNDRRWWMCVITLAVPIAALMKLRWMYPYGCSEDFRYIYPALVSFCGLYGMALEAHMQDWRPFRTAMGVGLAALFAACSVWFYLG